MYNIIYGLQFFMLLLDSFLFFVVVGILHLLKFKYPNFLFFCKGAVMFLAPEDPTPTQKPTKKSSSSQKQQLEVRIIQIQYQHVKQHPKCEQHDRILILLTSLAIYLPLRYCITTLLQKLQIVQIPTSTSFTFILILVFTVYAIKIGLEIFWISSYNIKYCILVAVAVNLVFFLLFLTLHAFGTYDDTFQMAVQDYARHIGIVVGGQVKFDTKVVLAVVLCINAILTLVSIPAVIKFGNWYTKTLKQTSYQDPQTHKITDNETRKIQEQKQKNLKKQTSKTIRLLKAYLFSILVFICLSHKYLHTHINQFYIDVCRIILLIVIVTINCYTLKDAIQFNASFAYKFIVQYAEAEGEQERARLKGRVLQYLYYIFYHLFQFLFRIIVPVLLFLMLIDWKYMHASDKPLQSAPVITHSHCGIQTSHLSILQNLYKCDPVSVTSQIHNISEPFLNGVLVGAKSIDEVENIQERVQKYGLLNPFFMTQLAEQLLWYANVTVFGMTIVYILFLRKTVYDM